MIISDNLSLLLDTSVLSDSSINSDSSIIYYKDLIKLSAINYPTNYYDVHNILSNDIDIIKKCLVELYGLFGIEVNINKYPFIFTFNLIKPYNRLLSSISFEKEKGTDISININNDILPLTDQNGEYVDTDLLNISYDIESPANIIINNIGTETNPVYSYTYDCSAYSDSFIISSKFIDLQTNTQFGPGNIIQPYIYYTLLDNIIDLNNYYSDYKSKMQDSLCTIDNTIYDLNGTLITINYNKTNFTLNLSTESNIKNKELSNQILPINFNLGKIKVRIEIHAAIYTNNGVIQDLNVYNYLNSTLYEIGTEYILNTGDFLYKNIYAAVNNTLLNNLLIIPSNSTTYKFYSRNYNSFNYYGTDKKIKIENTQNNKFILYAFYKEINDIPVSLSITETSSYDTIAFITINNKPYITSYKNIGSLVSNNSIILKGIFVNIDDSIKFVFANSISDTPTDVKYYYSSLNINYNQIHTKHEDTTYVSNFSVKTNPVQSTYIGWSPSKYFDSGVLNSAINDKDGLTRSNILIANKDISHSNDIGVIIDNQRNLFESKYKINNIVDSSANLYLASLYETVISLKYAKIKPAVENNSFLIQMLAYNSNSLEYISSTTMKSPGASGALLDEFYPSSIYVTQTLEDVIRVTPVAKDSTDNKNMMIMSSTTYNKQYYDYIDINNIDYLLQE